MRLYSLLSVIFLTFDAYALWIGIHPHVSDAYRKFFIEHSIKQEQFLLLYQKEAPELFQNDFYITNSLKKCLRLSPYENTPFREVPLLDHK